MKNISLLSILTIGLSLLFATTTTGQDELFNKNIRADIGKTIWMEQLSNGLIMVTGTKGTAAYDNKTGELTWRNEALLKADLSSFTPQDPLNLFTIKARGADKKLGYHLIDANTGEYRFSTTKKFLKITQDLDRGFLYLEINTKSDEQFTKINLETNEVEWAVKLSKKYKISVIDYESSIFVAPPIITDDKIIVAFERKLMAVSAADGSILWTKDFKSTISHTNVLADYKVLVVADKSINYHDPSTGEPQLATEIKKKKRFKSSYYLNDNDLLLQGDNEFNVLDLNTNTLKFKKSVTHFQLLQVDLLPTGDYLSYGKGDIRKTSPNGKTLWNESESNYFRVYYPDEEHIITVGSSSASLRSLSDGNKVKGATIYYTSATPTYFDEDESKFYIYERKRLKCMDFFKKEKTDLTEKFKLPKYNPNEEYVSIEPREGGMLLTGSNRLTYINDDGSIKFNDFYTVVKKSVNLVDMMVADQLGSDFVNELNKSRKVSSTKKTNQNRGTILGVGINSTRLDATFVSDAYQFIFTKDKEGPCFKKVNKDSGEVEKRYGLADRDPSFVVDEFDQLLIIAEGSDMLRVLKI